MAGVEISKIENGRQTPSDEDIQAWTQATGSASEAEGLLASLHTLEVQHAEWQRVLRTGGIRPRQNALAALDQQTRLFRVFEATVIPGLLQTSEYARARFAGSIRIFKLTNDVNEAVEGRMKRQDIFSISARARTRCQRPLSFATPSGYCRRLTAWWSWISPTGRPWCPAWSRSSPATTSNTRLGSKYMTCGTRIMRTGMVGRISDGRTPKDE